MSPQTLILPKSSPNKCQFFAKIQIFLYNFQCEIGLSIRCFNFNQNEIMPDTDVAKRNLNRLFHRTDALIDIPLVSLGLSGIGGE